MAELYIPDAAYEAAMRKIPVDDRSTDRLAASAMVAGAPHIVAAELRRIAEKVTPTAAFRLRARADELDPPQLDGDA